MIYARIPIDNIVLSYCHKNKLILILWTDDDEPPTTVLIYPSRWRDSLLDHPAGSALSELFIKSNVTYRQKLSSGIFRMITNIIKPPLSDAITRVEMDFYKNQLDFNSRIYIMKYVK